jgi:tyrosyl-tRNA synthetase
MQRFLDFSGPQGAVLVDNLDWTRNLTLLDFLRDVGKHFTVNAMLRKDSVKNRIEREGAGISFTEFSYMLLQAMDFLVLARDRGCTIQIGGSDQWGNITAGITLIRRTVDVEAHALTFPLVTNASGTKFGKTEAGAVWLDPERTSPYRFYQFWINTDDRDVGRMLRFFTLLDRDEIERLEQRAKESPEARDAQRALARDVTSRVHGDAALGSAEEVSQLVFGKADPRTLSQAALAQLEQEIPTFRLAPADSLDLFVLIDVVSSGKDALFKSKGEARRALEQGGLYLNGERVSANRALSRAELLHGRYVLVRKGARSNGLVVVGA